MTCLKALKKIHFLYQINKKYESEFPCIFNKPTLTDFPYVTSYKTDYVLGKPTNALALDVVSCDSTYPPITTTWYQFVTFLSE